MKIQIWSDVVCPFCYIGKRRLEKALANFEHAHKVEVEWKSFLLNPDMVTDPKKTTAQYLSETKGWSLEQTTESMTRVAEMAAEDGLNYQLDKAVVANPADAHRLLQYAKTQAKGDQMKERLFKAYFMEGANISDTNLLVGLATEIGVDAERAKEILASDEFEDAVAKDIYESRLLEVRGVPFFVLDNRYGISGAQSAEVFEETLTKAWNNYVSQQKTVEVTTSENGEACDVDRTC